nr:hypothetical protein [Tanacetum cinerariifolium]
SARAKQAAQPGATHHAADAPAVDLVVPAASGDAAGNHSGLQFWRTQRRRRLRRRPDTGQLPQPRLPRSGVRQHAGTGAAGNAGVSAVGVSAGLFSRGQGRQESFAVTDPGDRTVLDQLSDS